MTDHANGKKIMPTPRGPRLQRVLQFVDDNLQNPIHLRDLAAIANLSPFHFSRTFRETTGQSPHRFVRERRLEKAKQLVIEGKTELTEIAAICVFSSQASHAGIHAGRGDVACQISSTSPDPPDGGRTELKCSDFGPILNSALVQRSTYAIAQKSKNCKEIRHATMISLSFRRARRSERRRPIWNAFATTKQSAGNQDAGQQRLWRTIW